MIRIVGKDQSDKKIRVSHCTTLYSNRSMQTMQTNVEPLAPVDYVFAAAVDDPIVSIVGQRISKKLVPNLGPE